ncbi:MAG: DUF1499 domain-containing protein [Rhodobacteraceae bacterium]|nr:MAG: DUF1499 domain-containing protein [Paracoccaceae bacterium]
MGRLMMLLWVLIAVVVVGMGYIRLAPSDPAQWHVPPRVTQDENLAHGVKRLVQVGPDDLARLDAIIRATPRSRRLAGSVEEGFVTYVTRSRIMGFPDYTTLRQEGDSLQVYGRLRFGRSDLGVNRARVDGWLAELARVRQ